jgi:hypothetical protein
MLSSLLFDPVLSLGLQKNHSAYHKANGWQGQHEKLLPPQLFVLAKISNKAGN